MNSTIRPMQESDILAFYQAFAQQGWHKPTALFEQYFMQQQQGGRAVFVAAAGEQALGYATLLPEEEHGPFAHRGIPAIHDLNVLEKYQRQGVGSALLDEIERTAREKAAVICLGVGLHSGYGAAQRLYVKRGYVPDGSGVWYRNHPLTQYADCCNDDDLVLYLSKDLTQR